MYVLESAVHIYKGKGTVELQRQEYSVIAEIKTQVVR